MKAILGYILAGIGLIGFALSYESVRTALKISLPEQITETTLLVASIVVILIGVFFLAKNKGLGNGKHREVPIYEGNRIVGYRRS